MISSAKAKCHSGEIKTFGIGLWFELWSYDWAGNLGKVTYESYFFPLTCKIGYNNIYHMRLLWGLNGNIFKQPGSFKILLWSDQLGYL